jgi:hypothetical protein
MNKAKSDKIDGDKQQEIMRIANEVKWHYNNQSSILDT